MTYKEVEWVIDNDKVIAFGSFFYHIIFTLTNVCQGNGLGHGSVLQGLCRKPHSLYM